MLRTICYLAAACWLCSIALAGTDGLPVATENSANAAVDEISRLIEGLDGAEFADRQEASHKLSETGKEAFPYLEKAVERGNREVSGRALDILKRHFQGQDSDSKQAAQQSLERLAVSKHVTTAQRARNVLSPPATVANNTARGGFPAGGIPLGNGAFPGGGFGGGNGGIGGIGGFGGVVRRISIHNDANGGRSIEIQENDHKTKLQTLPNGKIIVEVTEKQNGKEVTKTTEAKDLNELRQKDSAAARLYEQYDRQPGGIRVGALPVRQFGGPVPIPVIPAPPAPPAASLKRALDSIDSSIERYKSRLPNDPSAQRMIDSLERNKQQVRELFPQTRAEDK